MGVTKLGDGIRLKEERSQKSREENANGSTSNGLLFQKKPHTKRKGVGKGGWGWEGRGVEDMEFPSFIKKKNHVEFPGVLVGGLKISEGCNTVLQSLKVKGEALFCVEFPGLK